MIVQKFEDLYAWQKAQDLAVAVYSHFNHSKDWGVRDQICRASVSVSNNIAEGFDRMSDKEFIRFLYIALASSSEVKSMLYLAKRLNYLKEEKFNQLVIQTTEVSKIITGLIKSVKKRTPEN